MFSSFLFAASLVATAFAAALPEPASSDDVSALAGPPEFKITSLGVNGSGCPPGSAYYVLNGDKTAVTVTFSEYIASAGPGIIPTENRKNCQVTLGVHVPSGFSFAIVDVDYRGFYQLDKSVNAYHDAMYYFQGQLVQAEATTTLNGPINGDNYVFRDTFGVAPVVFSPCGKESVLNINSAIRVDNSRNRQGFGFIANDSIDASIKQKFNFAWRRC